MIKPTVGRIIWVYSGAGHEPLPAIINSVISNAEITVTIFDIGFERHQRLYLYQDGDIKPSDPYPYAEWMPYQKGTSC